MIRPGMTRGKTRSLPVLCPTHVPSSIISCVEKEVREVILGGRAGTGLHVVARWRWLIHGAGLPLRLLRDRKVFRDR